MTDIEIIQAALKVMEIKYSWSDKYGGKLDTGYLCKYVREVKEAIEEIKKED